MDRNICITQLLQKELVQAMGCTEPAACALAGAKAAELLEGKPEQVKVLTTRDILKNAMGVNIPGFHKKGVKAAIALGVAGADSSLGLSILTNLTPEQKEYADSLIVDLDLVEDTSPLYIKVSLKNQNHSSCAIVSGSHTNFSYLEKDGHLIQGENIAMKCEESHDDTFLEKMTVDDIINYSEHIPQEIEKLLLDAIHINLKVAEASLQTPYGLEVGKTMMKGCKNPPQSLEDAMNVGAALAAGGSDARMAGCQLPVVINSGSGNQGITLTIPIAVVASYLKKTDHETAVALCIAELVGLVLTALKGRLSAQCGAFTAATGTGCGLAYLQGGNAAVLERVIKNMIGDLTGVICDGAKMTCALKIYSCVQSAYLACKLAMEGIAPTPECGIIGEDANKTLGNLSRLTRNGMVRTDQTILNIMLDK